MAIATAQARIDPSSVPGWGVDADSDNDPTYPMRDRTNGDDHGLTWPRPPLQAAGVEVLMSIEHDRRPAVFGTSSPPTGLSGAVRRRAFKFSESQWAHWLLLMLADRINMIEGAVDDFERGRPPNLVREWGLPAEWTYNRPALLRRLAIGVGAGALTVLVVSGLRGRERA